MRLSIEFVVRMQVWGELRDYQFRIDSDDEIYVWDERLETPQYTRYHDLTTNQERVLHILAATPNLDVLAALQALEV